MSAPFGTALARTPVLPLLTGLLCLVSSAPAIVARAPAAGQSAQAASDTASDTASAGAKDAGRDAAAILALPITPGSIALLVEHARQPAAQQRIQQALTDQRPEVRAVAARVALVTMSRGQLPHLTAALAQEQDLVAGAELARSVMTIGREPTYADAITAATRLGNVTADAVAETFGRLGARDVVTHLPALLATDIAPPFLLKAVIGATKGDPATGLAVLRQLASSDNPRVRHAALTNLRREDAPPLPADLFVTWLKADGAVRTSAIWALVDVADGRGTAAFPPDVTAALAPMIQASANQVSWDALGLAILARFNGQRSAARRWTTLSRDDMPLPVRYMQLSPPGIEMLSDKEREDLSEAILSRRDEMQKPRKMSRDEASSKAARAEAATGHPAIRTVPLFAGSLRTDLMRIHGCEAGANRIGVATAAYHPEGRARSISFNSPELPAACQPVARTLFSLTLGPELEPTPAGYSEVLLLPLTETAVACVPAQTRRPRSLTPTGSIGGRVESPKKLRHVPPVYPTSAQKDRVSGTVIIESVISEAGCVTGARVVRGVTSALDVAALLAVLEWQYSPTRLDGTPVPVTMTVTVSFTLR